MAELMLKEEAYKIIGAAMEVYNTLGHGFLEAVFQESLELEFAARGISFQAQREISISYKGKTLRKVYVADFLVFDQIIVEIKSISKLTKIEEAQLMHYLKATGCKLGLLINFGHPEFLESKRLVN